MNRLAFLDVDGTLAHPERSLEGPPSSYACVDHASGRCVAYASQRTIGLLAALGTAGVRVIPTTSRSAEQLTRMTLFTERPAVAIVSAGVQVLVDGAPDGDWHDIVRARASSAAAPDDIIAGLADHPARRVTRREGLLVVLAYDDEVAAAADGAQARARAAECGWVAQTDGRRTYLLPTGITKAAAAAHVASVYGPAPTWAAGDSALDLELLSWADDAWVPAGSWAASVAAPGVDVTEARGPAAAEEMCERLLLAPMDSR